MQSLLAALGYKRKPHESFSDSEDNEINPPFRKKRKPSHDPKKKYEGLYLCMNGLSGAPLHVKGAHLFHHGFLPVKKAQKVEGFYAKVWLYHPMIKGPIRVPDTCLHFIPKEYDENMIKNKAIVLASWEEVWWEAQIMEEPGEKLHIEFIGNYDGKDNQAIQEWDRSEIFPSSALVEWDQKYWEEESCGSSQ